MSTMQIAIVADPHVSLSTTSHSNLTLADTVTVTEAVLDDLERRRPDLTIWLGDLTHEGTDAVRNHFARMACRLSVPCLWMLGNHDVEQVTKRKFASQVVPCVFQQRFHAAGWDVLILDTVRELSPHDPGGRWGEADLGLLRETAAANGGPMLVLSHHPMQHLAPEPFWNAVGSLTCTGVYIGGHSHIDRYQTERNWHLIEVGSSSQVPYGYHWLELSAKQLTLSSISVHVEGLPQASTQERVEAVFPVTVSALRHDADTCVSASME